MRSRRAWREQPARGVAESAFGPGPRVTRNSSGLERAPFVGGLFDPARRRRIPRSRRGRDVRPLQHERVFEGDSVGRFVVPIHRHQAVHEGAECGRSASKRCCDRAVSTREVEVASVLDIRNGFDIAPLVAAIADHVHWRVQREVNPSSSNVFTSGEFSRKSARSSAMNWSRVRGFPGSSVAAAGVHDAVGFRARSCDRARHRSCGTPDWLSNNHPFGCLDREGEMLSEQNSTTLLEAGRSGVVIC